MCFLRVTNLELSNLQFYWQLNNFVNIECHFLIIQILDYNKDNYAVLIKILHFLNRNINIIMDHYKIGI